MKLVCLIEPFEYEQHICILNDNTSMQHVATATLDTLNDVVLNYSDVHNINDIDICGETKDFIIKIANDLKNEAITKYGVATKKNIGVQLI